MLPQITKLQELLKTHHIDAYIIPTADYHQSEYVGEYFKARKYMSNFTGSAGTLLVDHKGAYLWTDGRYFIQAANQLKDTGITLMKMGQPNVPTIQEFINENNYETLGFDGKVMSYKEVKDYKMNIIDIDLITPVWTNRPQLSASLAFIYDLKYCGERPIDKINRIRKEMSANNCDAHLVTTLDDIAWIFNIRGNDVHCNPVVLAYALITQEEAILYIQHKALSYPFIEAMKSQNVTIKEYNDIYDDITSVSGTILLDESKVNYALVSKINNYVSKANPSQLFKSIKNEVEIENTIKAHIKDGVAMTKFMYFMKTKYKQFKYTEVEASELLEEFRHQQGAMELSFDSIMAYNENAALMHYFPELNNSTISDGLLLIDSGGQYLEGTTDITRTFVLGSISDIQKKHFTAVLKSHINLASANFLYGCTGVNLDILARGPIWDLMIDYQCGTGHGVGHLLNVHEGPNSFRWRLLPQHGFPQVLEENMITTDEPGIYLEGQYGIRIESELLCKKGITNEYGTFMHFENITYCPIDLDGIVVEDLDQKHIDYLNQYHETCFKVLEPHLTRDEREWLKEYTRKI